MAHTQPSHSEWVKFKPILRELWGRTSTAKIIQLMDERYGFLAKKSAYDRHFKAWSWRKNLTAIDWYKIDCVVRKRKRDENKDSEVRVDGIVVRADNRAKRHRLSSLEQIRVQVQGNIELPQIVTISTPRPPDDVERDTWYRTPWIEFTEALEIGVSPYLTKRNTNVKKPIPLTSTFSQPATSQQDSDTLAFYRLRESFPTRFGGTQMIDFMYCCINGKHDLSGERNIDDDARCVHCGNSLTAKSGFLNAVRDLSHAQRECLTGLIVTLPGPVARTLARAMLVTAFEMDDVSTARILLPALTTYMNLPMSGDLLPRVSPIRRSKLADAIGSLAMTRLFQEFGGALSEQHDPIRPLYTQYFDDVQGFTTIHSSSTSPAAPSQLPRRPVSFTGSRADADAICKILIQMRHPEVLSSLSIILRCSTVDNILPILQYCSSDLLHSAVVWASVDGDEAKKSLISAHLEQRVDGGEMLSLAPMLAHAAFYGDLITIRALLERNAYMDTPAMLLYHEHDPMVGAALQFALLRNDFEIVRVLLDAGARVVVDAKSNLPPPLALAFNGGDLGIIELLLRRPDVGPLDPWSWTNRPPGNDGDESWTSLLRWKYICPLAIAASWRDRSLIEELINAGADLNQAMPVSTSEGPHSAICEALNSGDVELALYLTERGARLTVPAKLEELDDPKKRPQPRFTAAGHLLGLGKDTMDRFQVKVEDIDVCFAGGACCERPLDQIWEELHTAGQCHPRLRTLMEFEMGTSSGPLAEGWFSSRLQIQHQRIHALFQAYGISLNDISALLRSGHTFPSTPLACLLLRVADTADHEKISHANNLVGFHRFIRETARGMISSRLSTGEGIETSLVPFFDAWEPYLIPCMDDLMLEVCAIAQPVDSSPSESVVELVKLLHRAGIPITGYTSADLSRCPCQEKAPGDQERTPLWWSVKNGNLELLDFLLAAGALMDDPKRICMPALICAADNDNVEAVRRLAAAGGDVHRLDDGSHSTSLQTAAQSRSLDVVRLLLGHYKVSPNEPVVSPGRRSPLWYAAFNADYAIARELVLAGAHVDARESKHEGSTGHMSDQSLRAIEGTTALEAAATIGSLEVVAFLIISGADIGNSAFGTKQFNNAVNNARRAGYHILADHIQEQRREIYGIHGGSACSTGRR